jgi:hypothetical protein
VKLERRSEWDKTDFRCDLTYALDDAASLNQMSCYDLYHHYILVDAIALKEKVIPIRVPGGTVGAIWIDGNNKIVKIQIDRDYVVKTYPLNTHEIIASFIGETIEII